jgi:molybdopterin molybdotransferase
MPGEPLPPGAIYNSNRFMLGALLRGQGCIVTDLGNVPDRLDATRAMLREAAAGHDLILSSGGVSVGEEDHLKPALAAEGRLDLWAIAIKPGKPLAFGAVRRPGEGRARRRGSSACRATRCPATSRSRCSCGRCWRGCRARRRRCRCPSRCAPISPGPGRTSGASSCACGATRPAGSTCTANQGSGVLTSLAWGDGLADIAPGQAVQPGDLVRYLSLAELAP